MARVAARTHGADVPVTGTRARFSPLRSPGQVLLDEPRAEMDVQLHERLVADATKAVDLARFDHEDVAGAGLELLSFDVVQRASLLNELHLVVRMAVRPRARAGEPVEEEDGDADVAVLGADEVVRAAAERQVIHLESVHVRTAPEWAEVWLVPPGGVSGSASTQPRVRLPPVQRLAGGGMDPREATFQSVLKDPQRVLRRRNGRSGVVPEQEGSALDVEGARECEALTRTESVAGREDPDRRLLARAAEEDVVDHRERVVQDLERVLRFVDGVLERQVRPAHQRRHDVRACHRRGADSRPGVTPEHEYGA